MTDLRKHAEHVKLATLLRCPPEELAFIDALDLAATRRLRQSVYTFLHNENRHLFLRLTKASNLLPSSVAAFIAERTLGPLLCARVACEMSTARASDVARQLSPRFLASTVPYLDTLRAAELTISLPLAQVLAVSRELTLRKEFILMGNLVSELPTPLLEAVLKEIHDGEALLRIAFFVENTRRLNDILEFLPTTQLKAVILAAANEAVDLWPEALSLIDEVAPRWQTRLVNMAADEDESTLASMVHGIVRHDLWKIILPLLHLMTEANRRRIVSQPAVNDDAVIQQLLSATAKNDHWQHVIPLIPLMPDTMRDRAARLLDDILDDETMQRLVHICSQYRLWHAALPIIAAMSDARRTAIAVLLGNSSDDQIESFHQEVRTHHLWQLTPSLISCMTDAARLRFTHSPIFEDEAVLHEIVDNTRHYGSWPLLIGMTSHAPDTQQRIIARILENQEADAVDALFESLSSPHQWLALLKLMTLMRPERRSRYILHIATLDNDLLNDVLYALSEAQQWTLLMDVISGLPEQTQQSLLSRSRELDRDMCIQMIMAADKAGRVDSALKRIAELPATERQRYQALLKILPETLQASLLKRSESLGLSVLLPST